MVKFIMMIGLLASGKSTKAKELQNEIPNSILLSSDALRLELYNNINDIEHNGQIFNEMIKRTRDCLKKEITVIYDATNISSKRRENILKHQLKNINCYKECYYLSSMWSDCILNDLSRNRTVGKEVIFKMRNNMQVPMYYEGWDNINLLNKFDRGGYNRWLSNFVYEYKSEFLNIYKQWSFTKGCIEMPQDNPHHTYSLSRHMFKTYENLRNEGLLAIAGALHDVGKLYCKEFKEDGYAHYYNHENISAQLSIEYMLRFTNLSEDEIIYITTLIQLHMRVFNVEGLKKLRERIGYDLYEDLLNLHNADIKAK
ncbi:MULTISPECIES: AAA family ATPase [unclassified Clostridium]|uniref:AAA family ATPase n=1 Tax=unclassified Clostridium TaxID=2614128 RepID=UPI00207A13AD|nr:MULTISPECIES: AAA family ATPase [unclassified Clostridium]